MLHALVPKVAQAVAFAALDLGFALRRVRAEKGGGVAEVEFVLLALLDYRLNRRGPCFRPFLALLGDGLFDLGNRRGLFLRVVAVGYAVNVNDERSCEVAPLFDVRRKFVEVAFYEFRIGRIVGRYVLGLGLCFDCV